MPFPRYSTMLVTPNDDGIRGMPRELSTGPDSVLNTGGFLVQPFSLGAAAAPDNTSVAAALAGNNANNNIPLQASPNPAQPRNVRAVFAASYDGGNITVNGTDQFDRPQTEVIVAVANTTVAGTKIFKTITSATKGAVGANAATVSIGRGSKLGLSRPIQSTFGIGTANGVAEAFTVDAVNHAVTPTTAPNGSVVFQFLGTV